MCFTLQIPSIPVRCVLSLGLVLLCGYNRRMPNPTHFWEPWQDGVAKVTRVGEFAGAKTWDLPSLILADGRFR